MNKITFYFKILPVCVLLSMGASSQNGCSGAKNRPAATANATQKRDPAFLLNQLQKNDLHTLSTLTAKAQIFSSGDATGAFDAAANIIWIRDSVIWINVKKFGVEAVRALIRPDSVFVLNRIDQTITARSIQSLKKEYNLPGGFDMLQDALIGSVWMPEQSNAQSDIIEGWHRLRSQAPGGYAIDLRLSEDPFLVHQALYLQAAESRSMALEYNQYVKIPGIGFFPYLRNVDAYSPETGSLTLKLELSDAEFNKPRSYRFDIPAHYTRAE